ncbi:MAG TPA: 50S ribosomal protein L10 [Candidatus Saccharimonadales bacterium]|jgi:large subunit ribosomal protein L10|nr:50S ribosomal protein L10 [Candidatus Saccharimonadales bacterium]
MALTKAEKNDIVANTAQLLSTSKLTVLAQYPGTKVSDMQSLRHSAEESGTIVKVIKNRLVIKALEQNGTLANIDVSKITGQLLYAFNAQDEVAPAQVLNAFAKSNQTLNFVGAITADGHFINAEEVVALSELPSKDQLRARLIGTINAPLSGFANVVAANIRGIVNVLQARSKMIEV